MPSRVCVEREPARRQSRHAVPSALVALIIAWATLGTPVVNAGGSRESADAARHESSTVLESEQSEGAAGPTDGIDEATLRETLRNAGVRPLDEPVASEDFELASLSEETRSLSSFAGQVVVLNFWASWCGPCVEEMPGMQALYADLQEMDATIVAVNVQEQADVVRNFISQNDYSFPVLLDRDGSVARRYGVRGLPTSYILAPNGDIVAAKVGFHEWNTAEVRSALERIADTL